MKIAVAFATSNRKEMLSSAVYHLKEQTRTPDEIIICPARQEDVDEDLLRQLGNHIKIVYGRVGLPAQRNCIMDATDAEVVVFLDDDFLPAAEFVEAAELLFLREDDVVGATGSVIADGILGPGFDFQQGSDLLKRSIDPRSDAITDVHNAYGCNMAFRMETVRKQGVRFDENLPLYAWWEDVDFSRRMAPYGRIVRSDRLRGVHLGFKKSGRTPGRRLGYSQIANPVYLARKGNVSWQYAWIGMLRNLSANIFHLLRPEPWVDRRGRLLGNIHGVAHWLSGQLAPVNILEID
jgi:GT2 family glycosyltransferase